MIFSLFTSLVAPFGGFFASGFKRGIKIKDFGDTIPGHGGITDRMDCQILTVRPSTRIGNVLLSLPAPSDPSEDPNALNDF